MVLPLRTIVQFNHYLIHTPHRPHIGLRTDPRSLDKLVPLQISQSCTPLSE
jgi:hypothetical protein